MTGPRDRYRHDGSGLLFGLWHLATGCVHVDRNVDSETYLRPAPSNAILVASGVGLRAGANDYPTPTWNASAWTQAVPTQVLGTRWALRQASMRQRWCSRRQARVHRRRLFPTQVLAVV